MNRRFFGGLASVVVTAAAILGVSWTGSGDIAQAATAPAAYWIAPDYAYAGTNQPFTVTVWGAYIDGDTVGQWDGAPRPSTRYGGISLDIEITPEMVATPGNHTIRLSGPGGVSAAFTFRVIEGSYERPQIEGTNISQIAAGKPFTIFLRGRGFGAGARILVDGSPVPTRNLGENWLMAPGLVAPAVGPVAISVENAGPGGGLSFFSPTVQAAAPNGVVPGFTSVGPLSVQAGGPGFWLTAFTTGNYQAGSVLRLGGVDLETVAQANNMVSAYVPASMVATPGTLSLRLKAPDGTLGAGEATVTVGVTAPGIPEAPQNLNVYREGVPYPALTLFHSSAGPGAYVTWDGKPLPSFSLGGVFFSVSTSPSLFAEAGVKEIRVVNPRPGGGVSAPMPLTVYARADLDCRDGVTAADALLLMRVIAGLDEQDFSCPIGNPHGPGGLDLGDVLYVRRAAAGLAD